MSPREERAGDIGWPDGEVKTQPSASGAGLSSTREGGEHGSSWSDQDPLADSQSLAQEKRDVPDTEAVESFSPELFIS